MFKKRKLAAKKRLVQADNNEGQENANEQKQPTGLSDDERGKPHCK